MSDSTQSTNHVSLWHRIIGLRRHSSGNPTGTPPAANLQTIATPDNITQSKIEQGADLEQGRVKPAEDEGPLTKGVDQQSSPFTSSAFDRLPKPLPVEDIFFNGWWLTAVRILVRSLVIYYFTWSLILYNWPLFLPVAFVLSVSRYVLLKAGLTTVYGIPIQSKARLLRGLVFWPQKCWVCFHTR